MLKILIVDNYDSFTYNLVELVREVGGLEPEVLRNDEISLETLKDYSHIIFSPGPGLPCEAGLMPRAMSMISSGTRVLGVCLGHQCLGESFGAVLENLAEPLHGRATPIKVLNPAHQLFRDLPERFSVGRYHSWVVRPDSLPACMELLAVDDAGQCMAIGHRERPLFGLQFHPESVLTEYGNELMRNFLLE